MPINAEMTLVVTNHVHRACLRRIVVRCADCGLEDNDSGTKVLCACTSPTGAVPGGSVTYVKV